MASHPIELSNTGNSEALITATLPPDTLRASHPIELSNTGNSETLRASHNLMDNSALTTATLPPDTLRL